MQKITELLSKGKSPYHVTEWTGKQLQEAGYEELKLQESWQLHAGGKYYVRPYSGMVAAFAVPEQLDRKTALRLMLAHTDFPCFKNISPNSVRFISRPSLLIKVTPNSSSNLDIALLKAS